MVSVISDSICDDLVSARTDRMCTLGTQTNPIQAPCNSLGYLVLHRNLQFVLVGASAINHCSDFNPNMYPRVTEYLDWISSVTGILN